MIELDALLAGIVSDPLEETRWLVLADWLQENDDPRRAELLRLHRQMLGTCCEPAAHPERAAWQARMVELLVARVKPCVPQETLWLPGGVPMTFSFIPPGRGLLGRAKDVESPLRRVELPRGFFLATYPVTQEQWRAVLDEEPSRSKGAKRSVDSVTQVDCMLFCNKLSKIASCKIELPTDSEWEYACRAGTTTEFYFGDVINADVVNYKGDCSWGGSPPGVNRARTLDVGSFPPNPWSLYDLHGNLWEWCAGENGAGYGIARGGCYGSNPNECRAAYRGGFPIGVRNEVCGCRVCLRLT